MRRAALALATLVGAARAGVTVVPRPAAGDAPSVTSAWRLGRATFYGAGPSDAGLDAGACGYGDVTSAAAAVDGAPYGRDGVAAVADACADLHAGGTACGRCYELRCVPARLRFGAAAPFALDRCGGACRHDVGTSSVRVRVTDSCPCAYPPNAASNARWCCGDAPHFDLSAWAFDRLAASRALGAVAVAFRRVPCAPAGNVSVLVYSAQAGHRAELVFKNAGGAGALRSVEVRGSGGDADVAAGGDVKSWAPLARGWGATWQLRWPLPPPPLSLRLTAEDGGVLLLRHVITDEGALEPAALLRSGAQFAPQPLPPAGPHGVTPSRSSSRDGVTLAPFAPCDAAGPLAAALQTAATAAAEALRRALPWAAPQQAPTQAAPPDATMPMLPAQQGGATDEDDALQQQAAVVTDSSDIEQREAPPAAPQLGVVSAPPPCAAPVVGVLPAPLCLAAGVLPLALQPRGCGPAAPACAPDAPHGEQHT